MLTFTINGDAQHVTAEQFGALVDVSVRIMRDASRDTGVEFIVQALHASQPTVVWEPRAMAADTDLRHAFARVAGRITVGTAILEDDEGVPEWMAAATAKALYSAASRFGESRVDGVSFRTNGKLHKLTRQTFRTLDRVLHEETDAIGSVIGTLVTATLRKGAHVTVEDRTHGRGVECFVGDSGLRAASQLIGEQVTVVGRIRRDYLGRPVRIDNAKVESTPVAPQAKVAEMGGALAGGPDSVEWLRGQRGG